MFRHFVFALPLAVACSGSSVSDTGLGTSQDELGKVKHHYEPIIEDVHFSAGCGIKQNPPTDCTYGFVLRHTKDYVDLKETIRHKTDNGQDSIEITVDDWSYNTIHPLIAVGPQNTALGLLEAKVGETYDVSVVDRNGKELWTGKVAKLFHL